MPSPVPDTTGPDREALKNRLAELQVLARQAAAESRPELAAEIVNELLALDDVRLGASDLDALRRSLAIAETLIPTNLFDSLAGLYRKLIPLLRRHPGATTSDYFLPLNSLLGLYARKRDTTACDALVNEIIAGANQLTVTIDTATADFFTHLVKICEDSRQSASAAVLYIKLANFMLRRAEPNPELCVMLSLKAADSLARANQPGPGIQHLRSLLAVTDAAPGFDDGHRLLILNKYSQLVQMKGDVNEKRAVLEHACAIALKADRRHAGFACITFYNLASFYLGKRIDDRLDEAERLVQLGREMVADLSGRTCGDYATYLDLQAQIVGARGEPERAAPLCDEAIQTYERAPDTDADRFQTFLTFAGLIYLRLGRTPDAIVAFEKALSRSESSGMGDARRRADRMANLATAYFKTGDIDRAIALYAEAVELRFAAPLSAATPP